MSSIVSFCSCLFALIIVVLLLFFSYHRLRDAANVGILNTTVARRTGQCEYIDESNYLYHKPYVTQPRLRPSRGAGN